MTVVGHLGRRAYATVADSTVRLAYQLHAPRERSTASPLVIAHGLFGNKNNWNSLGKALAVKLETPVSSPDP